MNRTPPKLFTLIVSPMLAILTLNMFLPSLPNIAADLQATYAAVSLAAFSGYLVVTGVLMLVMGPLSDRYGRRPVILGALAVFAAASIGCASAGRLETFLIWRTVQGAVIGALTVSLAAIRDTTASAAESANRLGMLGTVMSIGPMIGAMVGGVLDQAFGWRVIFLALAGAGCAVLALVWMDFGETHHRCSATFAAQFKDYPALLASGVFWCSALTMVFGIGCFYIFISGSPLVAAQVFGMLPARIGIIIGIITVGFLFGNIISARYSSRAGLGLMMLVGRASAVLGMAISALALWLFGANAWVYFGCVILVGLGNGLSTPSAHAAVMSVRPHLAGSAAGLSGAMISIGGAVLTGFSAAVLHGPVAERLAALLLTAALAGLAAGIFAWRGLRHEAAQETPAPIG